MLTPTQVASMRDRLHNLDIRHDPSHRAIFMSELYRFFIAEEGKRSRIYCDQLGNYTIGIGYNLSKSSAAQEWAEVFSCAPPINKDTPINSDIIKTFTLTDHEINKIFEYFLLKSWKNLKTIYSDWSQLRSNEQLALISLYYNCPALHKKGGSLYQFISDYSHTGDPETLSQAVHYVAKTTPMLKHRRQREAELLNSLESPLYSAPHTPLIRPMENQATLSSHQPLLIMLQETIVPRGLGEIWGIDYSDSDHLVARYNYSTTNTQPADKIRALDGQVLLKKEIANIIKNSSSDIIENNHAYNYIFFENIPNNCLIWS